ncbi:TolC family protein [Mucilaginibacter rigui]|uniref:TolC family protein n=1 Tax=Mucilaginibacter rigui TaxID=534635 RepID=A0ABR7X9S5_9SPHI|nr:TolC family protein [Mucilaginibacter rigui]MBD1387319.1 TolC family protein [Mucilaginibacter rigui]
MKRILTLLTCITGALQGFSQTQSAPPQAYNFSVQDAVNYAYEHQDSVKNAQLDVRSAEYKVKETTGIGLPQINGTASFQDYLQTPAVLFPSFTDGLYQILNAEGVKGGDGKVIPLRTSPPQKLSIQQKYNANVGATLSQILFDGSYLVGLKASKTYKELSQRNLVRTRIETNVNVTKAYYQVLVSNEQIRLLDANINQLKQQVDQTTAQNKQGFVEKIDVDRITVQYNNLLTTRENTLRLLVLNYQLLKFQMGMPIGNDLRLTDKLTDVMLDANADAAVAADSSFYHRRIEYNLGETAVRLNQLDLKRKKAAYLPTLSFVAGTAATYQNNSFGQLFNTSYPSSYIGLNLTVPIFNGFQRRYQVKQSEVAVEKSINDLNNLKNGLGLQASQARVMYINGLQTLNNQKQSQSLAQEVLRVSKIKYQQGVGSSIEVTQAQTALEDADNKYIQGLYDALVSKVDLDKAYGRIQ